MLEIKNVIVQHAEVLFVLENIQIPMGSLVGIIGVNGSGKSTFLNSLIKSDSNQSIAFQNENWSALTVKQKAHRVTLIDNHFLGLPNLTTKEYLELGRIPHTGLMGILTANDYAVIDRVVKRLGIERLLQKATSTLSDGERQRVGIARALIQETPLILLDEPTAFLDYPTKKEVLSLLADIAKEEEKIILMSSHDLTFCLQYCSHFLVISKDRKAHFFSGEMSFEEMERIAFN